MSDTEWLVDLLRQTFALVSWRAPLEDFITSHCAAFAETSEENPAALAVLHGRFRALVESQLESHLAAVGLSGEEFYALAVHSPPESELRRIIETEVLIVDNFDTFKQLLADRNRLLDAAAAAELAGLRAAAAARAQAAEEARVRAEARARADAEVAAAAARREAHAVDDEAALAEAIRLSLLESDASARARRDETATEAEVIAASLRDEEERARAARQRSISALEEEAARFSRAAVRALTSISAAPSAQVAVPAPSAPSAPALPVLTTLHSSSSTASESDPRAAAYAAETSLDTDLGGGTAAGAARGGMPAAGQEDLARAIRTLSLKEGGSARSASARRIGGVELSEMAAAAIDALPRPPTATPPPPTVPPPGRTLSSSSVARVWGSSQSSLGDAPPLTAHAGEYIRSFPMTGSRPGDDSDLSFGGALEASLGAGADADVEADETALRASHFRATRDAIVSRTAAARPPHHLPPVLPSATAENRARAAAAVAAVVKDANDARDAAAMRRLVAEGLTDATQVHAKLAE